MSGAGRRAVMAGKRDGEHHVATWPRVANPPARHLDAQCEWCSRRNPTGT